MGIRYYLFPEIRTLIIMPRKVNNISKADIVFSSSDHAIADFQISKGRLYSSLERKINKFQIIPEMWCNTGEMGC